MFYIAYGIPHPVTANIKILERISENVKSYYFIEHVPTSDDCFPEHEDEIKVYPTKEEAWATVLADHDEYIVRVKERRNWLITLAARDGVTIQ